MTRCMLSVLPVLMGWCLSLAPVPAQGEQQPPADERLEEALADVKRRDPQTAERILQAMEEGGERAEEARAFLEEHAHYLERLAHASPEMKALLLRQEAKELEVRGAAERLAHAREHGLEKEARELRDALGGALDQWFDIRHELRAQELRGIEDEVERIREELVRRRENPEEARKRWLEELVAAGRDGLEEQLAELTREAEELERRQGEEPDEGAREELQLRRRVVEERQAVISFVRDHLDEEGRLAEIGEQEEKALHGHLDELGQIDTVLTERELEAMTHEIERRREMLERRARLKQTIVAIKQAELAGDEGLFEW